jgi:hypothetical protein
VTSGSRLLRLQQLAGNRAVANLVSPKGAPRADDAHAGPIPDARASDVWEPMSPPTTMALQRFGSGEHVRIGDEAQPGQTVDIGGEIGRISFGEMIALAGDYFESVDQLRRLAADWMNADQVRFALWKVNPTRPRPMVLKPIEDAVMERYLILAGRNEDHFSTGAAPGNSNRERYITLHQDAIRAAYSHGSTGIQSNSSWEAREAFADHYLTDAFSGGHVRTQRGDIKRHWESLYPNFINDVVRTIAAFMAVYINDHDNVGWVQTVDGLTDEIVPRVRVMGGAALGSFAVGDLIAKLLHDADNAGLDVVSAASSTSSGPNRWRAVGDGELFPPTPNSAASETQTMVQQAVRFSFEEAQQAFSAGARHQGNVAALAAPTGFRALPMLPIADAASVTNEQFGWAVSSIAALPPNIIALVNGAFAAGEIRRELDGIVVPPTMEVSGFTLSTGAAFDTFKVRLLANPMAMITRIANGQHAP